MKDPIASWISSDEKIFTDYIEYLKHELTHWFARVTGNTPIAKEIVDALLTKDATNNTHPSIDEMIVILHHIRNELQNPTTFKITRENASPVVVDGTRLLTSVG